MQRHAALPERLRLATVAAHDGDGDETDGVAPEGSTLEAELSSIVPRLPSASVWEAPCAGSAAIGTAATLGGVLAASTNKWQGVPT